MNPSESLPARLFRSLERRSGTDLRYLASGGFWLFAGNFAASLSAFLLAILFANFVEPETFGAYKYVLSIAGVLAIAVLPGIDTALQRAVARGREGSLMVTFRAKLRWGLLGSAGAVLVAGYYALHGNSGLFYSFAVVALFVPLMDTLTVYDDLLRGRGAFRKATELLALSQLVTTVAIASVLYLHPSLLFVLGAYFASWTSVRAIALLYVLKTDPPNGRTDESAVSYGKHLSVMKAASIVVGSLGNILLFQTIGGTALAVFTFALAPIEQVRGWMASIESLLLPKLSRDAWELRSAFGFLWRARLFFAGLGVFILAYCFLAPWLFSLAFPRYVAAIGYSQAYAPTLILTAANLLLASVLRAKKEVRALYITNGLSVASLFVLTVPLTYFGGIAGLILAIYLGKIVEGASMGWLIARRTRVRNEERIPR